MSKAILTCALTGVLTNPRQHPVPVTPAQMAAEARDAFSAGASIMHVHLRRQEEGMGHLPSWDPDVAAGQMLVCVEAMKMEMWIAAPVAATVVALHARAGDQVAAGAVLVEIEADAAA